MPHVVAGVVAFVKVAVVAVKAFAAKHALLWAGAKVASSLAVTAALAPHGVASSGSQLSFRADLDAGVPVAIGRTAVGGSLVFQYPSGPKNKHLNMFVVLSGAAPIEAIESFSAAQTETTFDGATGAVTNSPPWEHRMWMKTKLGATPDTALTQPDTPASDSALTEWTSAHKLSGLACAWWDVEYDSEVYANGVPDPLWVLKGAKCYDPRLDDTYPGGSGDCRLSDPDTWPWSENPFIVGHQFCHGWYQNGVRVAGAGIDSTMIDSQAFVDAANVADANNWTCGGQFTTRDSKWQVLKAILQAGGGKPSMSGARVSCKVSAPRTSLDTLTSEDLFGPVNVKAVGSRRDRPNSITPKYRSESHNWQVVAARPITVGDYVTADGGLKSREIDYTFVQDAGQAAQLAAYDICNAREIDPITLSVGPKWMGYRVGDCISLDIPDAGLSSQKAVITGRQIDPDRGGVRLTLVSETDSKHDFALGRTASPPPAPGLSRPDFAAVPAPGTGSWTATATQATNADGGQIATITVAGASDNVFALEVVVEYRKTGDSDWMVATSFPASQTTATFAGVAPNTDYDVAVRYRSIYRVTGARLELDMVTTLDGLVAPTQIPTIYVDGATQSTTFATQSQPTVGLLTQAMGHLYGNYTDVTLVNSAGIVWNGSDLYPDSCTTFWNNDPSRAVQFRVRTGSVLFHASASGIVDQYLSIWYRINEGDWTFMALNSEPGSGSGATAVTTAKRITLAAGDEINFGLTTQDADGNYWTGGGAVHQILNASLTVLAFNY